jgi:hypothetical protein
VASGMSLEMSGPLFDGRAAVAAQQMTDEIEQEIALEAGTTLIGALEARMQHPTGYYVSQIDVEPYAGGYRVWDQGVIYGPWLAGRGSRNRPRPGFPGYRHWRIATERVRQLAPEITRRVVNRWLPRMGG